MSPMLFIGENQASNSQFHALAFGLLDHVIDDMTVLILRTEHDNIRIFINLYIMSWWPVKQIIRADGFLCPLRVGHGKFAAQEKSPVGALTQITFQALKQWRGIDSGRETEVLPTYFA
jgi:hypothetical protein